MLVCHTDKRYTKYCNLVSPIMFALLNINCIINTQCKPNIFFVIPSVFWGHSRLGYYFWDKGLKEYVALDLVFIMIYYYLINKFYMNK